MAMKTETKLSKLTRDMAARIDRALAVAPMGQYDGAHHKTWVIDQMVRALTGDQYDEWVAQFSETDEDGTSYNGWEVGSPP